MASALAFGAAGLIFSPMKTLIFLLALAAGPALAQSEGEEPALTEETVISRWDAEREQVFDAADIELSAFRWIARPVVIFADSPFDPQFQQQMDVIESRFADLAERDVIVITDTDPDADSALRQQLRPRGFMLALIGKDGQIKLRKPNPWDVRELSRSIDKMPMRQQEIRDRRESSSAVDGDG